MPSPPRDPAVDDAAPTATVLAAYDERHVIIDLRLFDAEAEGADWKEVARIVLRIDPTQEPGLARRAWRVISPAPLDDGARSPALARRRGSQ